MAIVINGSGTVTGISVGGLPDDIVDAGTLADNAVGLAQMAGGTDGNIITYDTSGNPAVVATGSSGQVLTSAGADAVPTMATLSAGKVLQVVSAQYRTEVHTTSTSFVDSGLSASITPSSTSNKILVRYAMPQYNNTASRYVYSTLFRGTVSGTNLAPGSEGMGVSRISNESVVATVGGEFLDSPSTTSSQTYTVGFKCNAGQATAQINGTNSSLVLMEIAG